ncbi:MAG: RDD family protein [Spirochaetales bacterium]|nr:RDD family protein [Spirochaetales bacterium]
MEQQKDCSIKSKKKKQNYKKDFITIETADKIKLEYQIATPLIRFASFLIDFGILWVLFFLLKWLAEVLSFSFFFPENSDDAMFTAMSIFFYYLLYFVLYWGYYMVQEIILEGRTIGKLIFRLRVIPVKGGRLQLPAIILRNFLRFVDQDFTVFIGATISMLVSKEYRRIGDLAAGTVVIRENKLLSIETAFLWRKNHQLRDVLPDSATVILKKLSEQDLYVIGRLLNEYHSIPEPRRTQLVTGMAETIRKKIQDGNLYTNPLLYVKEIYARHHHGNTV